MISQQLQRLFDRLRETPMIDNWSNYEGPRFVTNALTSKAGSFYEKLRYTVDYQEEYAIRRSAIERILRRLVLYENRNRAGRLLLEELVRVGYVQNNTLPEAIAEEVQFVIDKFIQLESLLGRETPELWSYAATEIEQHLFPPVLNEAVLDAMFNTVVEYIKPKDVGVVSDTVFRLQVYIACRKLFLKDTIEEIRYTLFCAMTPSWKQLHAGQKAELQAVASHFYATQDEITNLVDSQLNWKIMGRLKNETIYFSLIKEIAKQYGVDAKEVLEDDERLSAKVTEYMSEIYASHKKKISTSGTHAIIYILITKIVIGLAIELPYEIFILGHVNVVAIGINILFFPILLFFMVKTVSYPGPENTDKIIMGMKQIIAGEPQNAVYITTGPRTSIQLLGFMIFYSILFFITFGAVVWLLEALEFNITSMFLFVFFLCVVSYFGLRVRYKSREWTIEKEDESLRGLLWYLISLPVTRTGRWVSTRLSSVNIFIYFMDFILETPFKIILGSFDSFVSFMKETRKDAI